MAETVYSCGVIEAPVAEAIDAFDPDLNFFRSSPTEGAGLYFDETQLSDLKYYEAFVRFSIRFGDVMARERLNPPCVVQLASKLQLTDKTTIGIRVPLSDERLAALKSAYSGTDAVIGATDEEYVVQIPDAATGGVKEVRMKVAFIKVDIARYQTDVIGYAAPIKRFLSRAKKDYEALLATKGLSPSELYRNPSYQHLRNLYELFSFPNMMVTVFLTNGRIPEVAILDHEEEFFLTDSAHLAERADVVAKAKRLEEFSPTARFIVENRVVNSEGRILVALKVSLDRLANDNAYRERFVYFARNIGFMFRDRMDKAGKELKDLPIDFRNFYYTLGALYNFALTVRDPMEGVTTDTPGPQTPSPRPPQLEPGKVAEGSPLPSLAVVPSVVTPDRMADAMTPTPSVPRGYEPGKKTKGGLTIVHSGLPETIYAVRRNDVEQGQRREILTSSPSNEDYKARLLDMLGQRSGGFALAVGGVTKNYSGWSLLGNVQITVKRNGEVVVENLPEVKKRLQRTGDIPDDQVDSLLNTILRAMSKMPWPIDDTQPSRTEYLPIELHG